MLWLRFQFLDFRFDWTFANPKAQALQETQTSLILNMIQAFSWALLNFSRVACVRTGAKVFLLVTAALNCATSHENVSFLL